MSIQYALKYIVCITSNKARCLSLLSLPVVNSYLTKCYLTSRATHSAKSCEICSDDLDFKLDDIFKKSRLNRLSSMRVGCLVHRIGFNPVLFFPSFS